jgi:hypothetical protein
MRRLVRLFTLAAAIFLGGISLRGATTVDLFVDFEDSTPGATITKTFLTNSSHGAVVGPWSPNPIADFTAAMVVGGDNLNFPFRFHVIANSVHYDGSGTRSLRYDHTQPIPSTETAAFTLPGGLSGLRSNVSMGVFVRFGAIAPDANLYGVDWWVFEGATNAYCVCQQWLKGGAEGTNYLQAHADTNGVTTRGVEVPIQFGRLYWVTLLRDPANGVCRLQVYDVALNLALVGTSDSPMTPFTYTFAFKVGNNFATEDLEGVTDLDNLSVDYTDGTFLLPFDPQIVQPFVLGGRVEMSGMVDGR